MQCFESNFVNIDFDQNTDGTLKLGLQGAKLFLIEKVNCNIGQQSWNHGSQSETDIIKVGDVQILAFIFHIYQ